MSSTFKTCIVSLVLSVSGYRHMSSVRDFGFLRCLDSSWHRDPGQDPSQHQDFARHLDPVPQEAPAWCPDLALNPWHDHFVFYRLPYYGCQAWSSGFYEPSYPDLLCRAGCDRRWAILDLGLSRMEVVVFCIFFGVCSVAPFVHGVR